MRKLKADRRLIIFMNIGVDIRPLLDPIRSGIPEYTHNLLSHIFKIDRDNQYFLFYNIFNKNREKNLPKWDYPNVFWCATHYPNKVFNLSSGVFGYPKFDRIIDERFKVKLDLFICFNYELISLSSRLKKIVVAHDLSFAINPDWFSLKRRIKYQWLMNPYNFFKQTDLIIAVSENTKRDLMDLYKISENKIKVIYPGVSDLTNQAERNYLIDEATKINLKSNEAIKEKLNLPEKFILFLGTIEPRKNILGIIKAFETWKKGSKIAEDYFLVLAGARGQASKGIWKAIKKSPFKDKIKYLSYVDENEKFVLYRLAKLFLYPSFYEGFGFPPLEAMSCGTPVIASISSSFPEVLGDSALLINPYDINDIVRGIEVMLENQEIRERFVKNGLERVKIFNWEKCALEWVNLISKF